ncbi:MAG: hypothetical protein EAZ92_12115 [Candidatus Kapaibacterium sp.]|nr:MAG: hypothetical protein EAZ92_12115 [Candidatus Kapabacteria bacterium]
MPVLQNILLRAEQWYAFVPTWLRWLLVASWYGLITYISHIPSSASAATKGMVGGDDTLNAVFRFCAHLGVFGILGTLLYAALNGNFVFSRRIFLQMLVGVCCAGILDEVHQSFVPGRFARVRDVATDCAGAVLAVGALASIRK